MNRKLETCTTSNHQIAQSKYARAHLDPNGLCNSITYPGTPNEGPLLYIRHIKITMKLEKEYTTTNKT